MKINKFGVIAPTHYPTEHWSEAEVLGSLVWLWQYVPSLKNAPLSYFMGRIVPYLQHRQFALFIENDRVVGYVSWAYLDETTEHKYIQSQGHPLTLAESKSGDRMWIIDWFAPFGHTLDIKEILSKELFPLSFFRSLYHRGKEKGLKVMCFKGNQLSREDFKYWQHASPISKIN
ncbi:toxin-activating lysine-acyltransferase [Acinetobacter sp. ANC 4636]